MEHSDLAKAVAAHLPEMQARLSGNQAISVHIDMNGQAADQGRGSFGGSNGSAEDRQGYRNQPEGSGTVRQGGMDERVIGSSIPAIAASGGLSSARLDIRV
jgi:hypothetical protein